MSLKVVTGPLMIRNGIPSLDSLQSMASSQPRNGYAAAILNRERDEDGPPIASSFSIAPGRPHEVHDPITRIGFVSVADGLGGSGKRRVMAKLEGQWQKRTMAYIASRKAQEAAKSLLERRPESFTRSIEEIRRSLHSSLQGSFSTIKFKQSWFEAKGDKDEDFPTTFSAAVIQETKNTKRVLLFWAGDSPLFVFSPDRIMTTHQPKADLSFSDGCITLGNYNLQARQFDFSPDTPLLVVAASDGIVKFKDLVHTNYFIIESV